MLLVATHDDVTTSFRTNFKKVADTGDDEIRASKKKAQKVRDILKNPNSSASNARVIHKKVEYPT